MKKQALTTREKKRAWEPAPSARCCSPGGDTVWEQVLSAVTDWKVAREVRVLLCGRCLFLHLCHRDIST